MSLLNDALRSAEQRREHPHAPAAYPGQVATRIGGTSPAFAILIAVAVLATLAAFVLLWLWLKPDPAPMETLLGAPFAEAAVTRPEPVFEEPAASAKTGSTGQPSEGAIDTIEIASEEPEAPETEKGRAPEPQPETEPERDIATVKPPSPAAESKPEPEFAVGNEPTPAPSEAAPAVKQQRETPELADRRTEKSIRQALSAGQFQKAEATLSDLLAIQPAPRSRARLARYLLVNQRPQQALTWLPRDMAATDDALRLLRARGLLALGQTGEAVALLESNVPGVRQNAEYTVTLATLLQQQDRANDAAGRWAELIAFDDARAAWWVGLAIALEADQQFRAATRAFEQAMVLPDLPPSLAEYVRSRLTKLGAG